MKLLNNITFTLTLLFLFSCGNPVKEEEAELNTEPSTAVQLTPEQREISGIEVGPPEKKLIAEVIDCTGFIDVPATNRAIVHAPMNGLVQQIRVVPGRRVELNEEIAVITDQEIAELKESFLNQRLNLIYWDEEFKRKKKLYEQEAISKKDYLIAQKEYQKEKYSYQSVKEQLLLMGISEEDLIENGITSKISIHSPIKGYVSEVNVNIGSFVDEESPMFEIINYDHVHLELSVYSNDISKIEVGQRVRFKLAGSEQGGWGTILLVGRKVDEINRSVLVHAHIDDFKTQLTIGSSLVAEILTQADTVFCLPEEAVIQEGDLSFVFTESTNGFEKTIVQTGRKFDGYLEILGYNKIKLQHVVTSGAYYLAE